MRSLRKANLNDDRVSCIELELEIELNKNDCEKKLLLSNVEELKFTLKDHVTGAQLEMSAELSKCPSECKNKPETEVKDDNFDTKDASSVGSDTVILHHAMKDDISICSTSIAPENKKIGDNQSTSKEDEIKSEDMGAKEE